MSTLLRACSSGVGWLPPVPSTRGCRSAGPAATSSPAVGSVRSTSPTGRSDTSSMRLNWVSPSPCSCCTTWSYVLPTRSFGMVAVVGAIAICRLMTRPCLTGVSAGTSCATTVSGVLGGLDRRRVDLQLGVVEERVASAFVLPTTSGTSTLPVDTNSVTVEPALTDVPSAGSVLVTWPCGNVGVVVVLAVGRDHEARVRRGCRSPPARSCRRRPARRGWTVRSR